MNVASIELYTGYSRLSGRLKNLLKLCGRNTEFFFILHTHSYVWGLGWDLGGIIKNYVASR